MQRVTVRGLSQQFHVQRQAPFFFGTSVQLALRKNVLLILRTSVSYRGGFLWEPYKYEIYRTQLIAWEYVETEQSPQMNH